MAGELHFNGASVVFSGVTIGKLKGIRYSQKAKDIDVTCNDDTTRKSRSGIPKEEVTVDVMGPPTATVTVGTTATLTIVWPDATTHGSISNALLLSRDKAGQLDGEVSASFAFTQGWA